MSLFNPTSNRNMFAAAHDALMAALSFLLAVYLRLGPEGWPQSHGYLIPGTVLFTLITVIVSVYMRLYRGLWRYASMQDVVAITKVVTLSILIFAALMFAINRLEGMPRSVLFINWMLLLFMLGAPRFIYRAFRDRTLIWRMSLREVPKIPVLLIGAGDQAEQFIRDMARDTIGAYEPVALVVDDRQQKGRTIHRVPIHIGTDKLPAIIRALDRKARRPQKIILTDDTMPGSTVRHLLEIAEGLGIPLARMRRLSEFKHHISDRPDIQPIAVEDLLGRSQNVLDQGSMQRLVAGRKILITGAGGSIGGELTRQIARFKPSELILVELSEFNLYQIEREMQASFPEVPFSVLLADVRDEKHIDSLFAQLKPQLVFHAAAIKHVPIAQRNIEEAILTNVFGTRHIAQACKKHHVEAMVMISTDKAVNPASVMGATKRLAEHFCQALGAQGGGTKFVTVRFGNVLGSTGSVVPLFREQLAAGGPLTVTHADMTRYFMTMREAVELVLQAAALGVAMERQEAIFVLDMGQPVRILDLALQMIRLAGLRPHEDIEIAFTGPRPGEKLVEELFHFSENAVKTSHESIFLASARFTELDSLHKGLDRLFTACSERKTDEALAGLKKLVPEFQPTVEP